MLAETSLKAKSAKPLLGALRPLPSSPEQVGLKATLTRLTDHHAVYDHSRTWGGVLIYLTQQVQGHEDYCQDSSFLMRQAYSSLSIPVKNPTAPSSNFWGEWRHLALVASMPSVSHNP